ncbi:uncharacterized protein SOCG_04212 [Schizosaccharomyces octosporus yFS286]|uniref:Uncharacterized protein n=1 Tax=Schizosaccharomyces octosporus (strain yFS286) TaxID=483514 RepID=S9QWQ5_SCHOY|nr:uncharacterized protein SOCG_04212 [Schizosaccharomyces octosporus yFS286]EPX70745.1 hypothetical protein SOCG_04212 [Schizosaccharomyces octosporus yFS286]
MNDPEEYFQKLNNTMLAVNNKHNQIRISPQKARAQRDAWRCFRDMTRTQNEKLQTTRRESKWNKQRGGSVEMNRFIDQNTQQEHEKQLELASEEYVLDPADMDDVQEENFQEFPPEYR